MNEKIFMRLCIGCGQMKVKKKMLRVLKPREGVLVLDLTGKKNGRGAYLCWDRECLNKAIKRRGLEKSFKMSIPKEVYLQLTEELDKIEAE